MTRPTADQFNSLIRAYAICTLILFAKWFIALISSAEQANHPAEDEKTIGGVAEPEPQILARRKRVFANDIENIPLNMIVFWAAFVLQFIYYQLDGGKEGTIGLTVLICVYTSARCLFHICYLYALQPYRTICFVIGNVTTAVAASFLVAAAFKIDMNDIYV